MRSVRSAPHVATSGLRTHASSPEMAPWWYAPKKWKWSVSLGLRMSMLASGKDASCDAAVETSSVSSLGVSESDVMSSGTVSAPPPVAALPTPAGCVHANVCVSM